MCHPVQSWKCCWTRIQSPLFTKFIITASFFWCSFSCYFINAELDGCRVGIGYYIVTTLGPGQNSHNIRYLSQGTSILLSGYQMKEGWQVATISDICQKVVVTIPDTLCIGWPFFLPLVDIRTVHNLSTNKVVTVHTKWRLRIWRHLSSQIREIPLLMERIVEVEVY